MRYRSTSRQCAVVSLREAVLRGLSEDGGLYMPVEIPQLPADFFERLPRLSFPELSFEVAQTLLGDELSERVLRGILSEALDFPVPLKKLDARLHILELFHGPTLAFKDFGARFMARLMAHFVRESSGDLTVLVATSGDTGSAVAHGFLGVPGIRVVILYPQGRISPAQEKQFTTLGENITALEVEGTFDDCQRLVKQAFAEPALQKKLSLTSANSINLARLIPQTFYYFAAWAQLQDHSLPIVFSVPSGNFGNVVAGLMAKRMGLPVAQIVAATNCNDVVPEYLRTGAFTPRPSQATISNAMDVGNPSNFARLLDLYGRDIGAIRKDVWGAGFSDRETEDTIRTALEQYAYLLDPHTAVGLLGLRKYQQECQMPCEGIVLATAHPSKFADVIERAAGCRIEIPERLAACLSRQKLALPLSNNLAALEEFLLA